MKRKKNEYNIISESILLEIYKYVFDLKRRGTIRMFNKYNIYIFTYLY